jgi:hypothetical protein
VAEEPLERAVAHYSDGQTGRRQRSRSSATRSCRSRSASAPRWSSLVSISVATHDHLVRSHGKRRALPPSGIRTRADRGLRLNRSRKPWRTGGAKPCRKPSRRRPRSTRGFGIPPTSGLFSNETTWHPAHIPQEVAGNPRPPPEIPATPRAKHLLSPVIPAYSRPARNRHDRPVTPEVAGSSPVAPAKYLQIGIFCRLVRRNRPPAASYPAQIPHAARPEIAARRRSEPVIPACRMIGRRGRQSIGAARRAPPGRTSLSSMTFRPCDRLAAAQRFCIRSFVRWLPEDESTLPPEPGSAASRA